MAAAQGENRTPNAEGATNSVPQTNQLTLKERADKMREIATKERNDALSRAQYVFNESKKFIQEILAELEKKQRDEMKPVEHEHMKADIIAAAIWRNGKEKLTSAQKSIESKYQEMQAEVNKKIAEVVRIRDAAIHAADEKFTKMYAEAEGLRKKAAGENKEVLAKSRAEYSNVVRLAQARKNQAEIEFWSAASNYNAISTEQLVGLGDKYEAELDLYESTLKEADKKWQNMLTQIGVGKQHEEAINKAVNELVDAHRNAASVARTAIKEYNDELEKVQNLKTDITRAADMGKNRVEAQFKEALNKAKLDSQKKYNLISQKIKKKTALGLMYLKKMQAQFQQEQAEISAKFEAAMKEALLVENGTKKPFDTKPVETVTGQVAESQKN